MTGERIRDKIAASKRKGMWMGEHVPLGYESIAAAHFVCQQGLRQQFRFYLALLAVSLTIFGLAFRDRTAQEVEKLTLSNLPHFLYYIFIAVGIFGIMMLLAMMVLPKSAQLVQRPLIDACQLVQISFELESATAKICSRPSLVLLTSMCGSKPPLGALDTIQIVLI